MVRKVSVDGPFCFGAGHLRAISPGIVSSLAFSGPDPSSGSSCLAAGSFSGSVGLYDPSSSTPLIELLAPSQRGGVTKVRVLRPLAGLCETDACMQKRQVLFHPLSPHLLFAASRQSSNLDVWDLRNTSRTSSSGRLPRNGRTNQRLGFDIDPTGTWLAAGDQVFNHVAIVYSGQRTDKVRARRTVPSPFSARSPCLTRSSQSPRSR